MGKVAVTGGAGFIGTNLTRGLVERGFETLVIDDFSTGLNSNLEGVACEIAQGSLVDYGFVEKSLRGCDYIFHLGARGSVPRSIADPRATFEVNTVGTFNTLEVARKQEIPLCFSSSSSVYGRNDFIPKSEEMWLSPLTPYGASKLAGESLVASYGASYEMNLVTYRFFNIFGPWQRPDHIYAAVIPKWIWSALNGREVELFGDGSTTRDFTYVSTVVEVLISGMITRIRNETPINLAFGNQISLSSVLERISELVGEKLNIKRGPFRSGDIKNSQNDPSLIKRLFPEVVPVDFADGLAMTLNWIKSQPSLFQHR